MKMKYAQRLKIARGIERNLRNLSPHHPIVSVMPHILQRIEKFTGNTQTDTRTHTRSHKYFRRNIFGIHKIDEIIDVDENVWNEPIDCAMPKNIHGVCVALLEN